MRTWVAAVLSASMLLSACSTRALLADALVAQAQDSEDDLQLAREASAFYLKLGESVLREQPGHTGLAAAVAGGFAQYAYAFVAFEAERLEARDLKAAQGQRQRAERLYARAQQHALRALEAQSPGFAERLAAGAVALPREQVGLAYWGAAAWAARISLAKDRPEIVADLPLALNLAQAAWRREPGWGDGDLASLMGTLEAARPGGSPAQAARYFEQAQHWAGGRKAGVFVAQAEALATQDRASFETLLRQALGVAAQHPNLANAVMRERAQWLLDTLDERF